MKSETTTGQEPGDEKDDGKTSPEVERNREPIRPDGTRPESPGTARECKCRRDAFFYLNCLFLVAPVLLLVITWRYLPISTTPALTVTKIVFLALAAASVAFIVIFKGKFANRVLFVIWVSLLVAGQLILNPAVLLMVGTNRFPVESTRYPIPYMMFVGEPHEKDHNALGYRGEAPAPEKGDEYRVFVLGGSTVYGPGRPLDMTIPGLLEKIAHENGAGQVAVYNWGVTSQVSGMEVTTILHRTADYRPDMVILYDGGNDVYLPYYWDPRPGYPFNFIVHERTFDMLQQGNPEALSSTMLSRVNLFRLLFVEELEQGVAPVRYTRLEAGYGLGGVGKANRRGVSTQYRPRLLHGEGLRLQPGGILAAAGLLQVPSRRA